MKVEDYPDYPYKSSFIETTKKKGGKMKEMWTITGFVIAVLLIAGIISSGCRFIYTVWKASNKILTHHMVLQLNKGAKLIYEDVSNSSNKECRK